MVGNTDIDLEWPCQLRNVSCMGCCGRNFKTKDEVMRDIEENTFEFKKLGSKPTVDELREFMWRFSDDPWEVKESGVCSNVVKFDNGVIACPCHPCINELVDKSEFEGVEGVDIRVGYCDFDFVCLGVKKWRRLSKQRRAEFIEWVEGQDMDAYEYSVLMVEGKAVDEFLKTNN